MNEVSPPLRFIIFKIHPVSARIQFICTPTGNICFPNKLPNLSSLIGSDVKEPSITVFPKSIIEESCKHAAITSQNLKILTGFRRWVETPSQKIPIYAMQVVDQSNFVIVDGYKWIELMDCFSLPPIERQILRSVYQWLLE